jgi:Protein of unknown function (DUF2480)
MEEIVNKVANSSLQVFDLEDYYTEGVRTKIDISQWLHEGFILKEKEFRTSLKDHNWQQYKNQLVVIYCPLDIIIPAWAKILVASYLGSIVQKSVVGSFTDLETALYLETLQNIDYSIYQDKPIIIKGCSKKAVPESAYIIAIQKLMPFAKSIMYGEACSAVPLFKKNK